MENVISKYMRTCYYLLHDLNFLIYLVIQIEKHHRISLGSSAGPCDPAVSLINIRLSDTLPLASFKLDLAAEPKVTSPDMTSCAQDVDAGQAWGPGFSSELWWWLAEFIFLQLWNVWQLAFSRPHGQSPRSQQKPKGSFKGSPKKVRPTQDISHVINFKSNGLETLLIYLHFATSLNIIMGVTTIFFIASAHNGGRQVC